MHHAASACIGLEVQLRADRLRPIKNGEQSVWGLLIVNGWHLPLQNVLTAQFEDYPKRRNCECASRAATCNFSGINVVHGSRCAKSCGVR